MFSKTGFSCWLLAVTAVAVAALLVWPAVALSSIPTEQTATVSLGVSARGSVQKTLLLAGTTAYADERFAISPQSGIAVWVTSKQEGQSVARGEALLRLDVTAQENLLAACYAKPSEKSLSSELLLAAGGQPRLSADQLKESISQSTVRAHEAGQVLRTLVRPGEAVQAGTPVALLASSNQEIRALADAHERRQLRPGLPVRLEQNGAFIAWGRVESISSLTVDSVSGLSVAQVNVKPVSPLSLAMGESVEVSVILEENADTVTVPLEALDDQGRIWQVHDGRAWPLAADAEVFDDQRVPVTGLSENTPVILSPPNNLVSGQRIREALE